MIKALLFDKDATLLDFEKTWGGWSMNFLTDLSQGDAALFKTLAAAVGFDPIQINFSPDSPVIAGTPEESVELLLPMLPGWSFDTLLAHSNEMARDVEVFPIIPLVPVLEQLKSHAQLGIATNDTAEAARRHMSSLGVDGLFSAIFGSDSGFGGKPGPGMCQAFANQMALPVSQIAMIGDSSHDMEAGRAAGMFCIGVTSGYASVEALSPLADLVLPDISYLPDWLDQRNA